MNILIVDDQPTNLRLLRAQLETEGHAVRAAADGVEALAILGREGVDAIISDILMPRLDGYGLCREVRNNHRLRHLPFIFYTATYTSASDEKLCFGLGGDAFLRKPTSIEAIQSALQEAARRPRTSRPPLAPPEEMAVLKEYSAQLVSKLEDKCNDLSAAVQRLQASEASLRESERRFSGMLSNVQLAAVMLDREARITYCNEYLLGLTGWRSEEVIGKDWVEHFLPPEITVSLRGVFGRLLDNQQDAWHYDNEIMTRAGSRRLIRWNNSVLRSGAGDTIGVASIGEDITERKQAEDVRRKRTEELEEFHRLSVGRELQMIELKKEVNALAQQSGEPAPYDLSFLDRP